MDSRCVFPTWEMISDTAVDEKRGTSIVLQFYGYNGTNNGNFSIPEKVPSRVECIECKGREFGGEGMT